MKTRAKLVCVKVDSRFEGSQGVTPPVEDKQTSETVKFETRYNSEDSQEDNSYSMHTPSANMDMYITNPLLFGKFEEGKAYYFDITPCEEKKEEEGKRVQTIGEHRVRTSFNASGSSIVDAIKQKSAELINICEDLKEKDGRLAATAQTGYEEAAMWAIKAATA